MREGAARGGAGFENDKKKVNCLSDMNCPAGVNGILRIHELHLSMRYGNFSCGKIK